VFSNPSDLGNKIKSRNRRKGPLCDGKWQRFFFHCYLWSCVFRVSECVCVCVCWCVYSLTHSRLKVKFIAPTPHPFFRIYISCLSCAFVFASFLFLVSRFCFSTPVQIFPNKKKTEKRRKLTPSAPYFCHCIYFT